MQKILVIGGSAGSILPELLQHYDDLMKAEQANNHAQLLRDLIATRMNMTPARRRERRPR